MRLLGVLVTGSRAMIVLGWIEIQVLLLGTDCRNFFTARVEVGGTDVGVRHAVPGVRACGDAYPGGGALEELIR